MLGNGSIVNDKCSLKQTNIIQLNPKGNDYRRQVKLCVPDISLPENNIENYINYIKEKNIKKTNKKVLYFTLILISEFVLIRK